MTSVFSDRRNKRNEVINPPHISNSRGRGDYGYEKVDNRYNEPIEYRDDRVCNISFFF